MKGTHIYQTKGVYEACKSNWGFYKEVISALSKFLVNDWGDTCLSDKTTNNQAVEKRYGHIIAKYITSRGDIYVVTEIDSTTITILFADEYLKLFAKSVLNPLIFWQA